MDADHPDLEEAYAESCDRMALQEEVERLRAVNRELISALKSLQSYFKGEMIWEHGLMREIDQMTPCLLTERVLSLAKPTKTPPRPV